MSRACGTLVAHIYRGAATHVAIRSMIPNIVINSNTVYGNKIKISFSEGRNPKGRWRKGTKARKAFVLFRWGYFRILLQNNSV